jgi:twinkle protein
MRTDILIPDDIDFDLYLVETDPAEKVRPARDFLDEIMYQIAPAHDTPKYPKLPFIGAWVYFAPGEVTLWGGFNGSGKSMLTGQVVTEFAEGGQKICIASFEMKPAKTLVRINRQSFCTAVPSRNQVEGFLARNDGRIWLYDQQGTVKADRMIAVVKHCAEKLGCHHIVIDSLMKCVMGEDDYNGQKRFVDELTAAARDYNTHIHLVAHLKKGDTDERLPTRMDIKGTGAISDLVDNVLILWRNKKKERDTDAGKQVNDSDPDSILICDKNRNGDYEGRTKLWFDRAALRFSDRNSARLGLAKELK